MARNKPVTVASASGSAKMPGKEGGGLSKRAKKRIKQKGKARETGPIIDLTSEATPEQGGSEEFISFQGSEELDGNAQAGPSRLPDQVPQSSGFVVIPRSIIAGVGMNDARASATEGQEGSELPSQGTSILDPTLGKDGNGSAQTHPEHTQHPPNSATASGLLLPDHITLDSDDKGDAPSSPIDNGDMEGLHFIDDTSTRGAQRYFVAPEPTGEEAAFLASADQSRICGNCKRPGHMQRDCPHFICAVCGAEDDHERRDCPYSLVCFACGQRGHRQSDCTETRGKFVKRMGCDRCGARNHVENACPSVWRVYAYLSAADRQVSRDTRRKVDGWAKEAIGGSENEEWCYNCAKKGHLGDDCPRTRGSTARLFTPSAFSFSMSSRGPYAGATKARNRNGVGGTPTHIRFDDDDDAESVTVLNGDSSETKLQYLKPSFEGLHAGRKSREKANRNMAELEVSQEGEEDWFNNPDMDSHGPATLRKQRSSDRGRGQNQHRGTPRTPRNGPPSRGTGVNSLPFSHSHLMSPRRGQTPRQPAPQAQNKQILFGKLSLPHGPAKGNKPSGLPPTVSPVHNNGKGRSKLGAEQAQSPYPQSINASGITPGRKAKKRRQPEPSEKDWETEWRRSGVGGGNVASWGKEMDKAERLTKKRSRTQLGLNDGGGGNDLSIKGRASGQKYMGGY